MTFLILLILLALILCFSYYAYRVAFYVPKNHPANPYAEIAGEQYVAVSDLITRATKAMEKHRFQPVRITAQDGTELFGRLYLRDESAPLQILFHGYRSSAFRDCCGGHTLAWKMGFNTIVVDQRAHGESQGRAITFGIKERLDCLDWVKYAVDRFGKDVIICITGLSMGAATVLSAAELDLPDNVVCIMADSPFDSPESIIRKVCRDDRLPDKLAWPFVRLGARLFGGFDITETSPLKAVRHANVPILLLHGEDDRFVPCSMSHEIAKNCASSVELKTFPGAGHGLAYMTDPETYEIAVFSFLRSIPALREHIKGEPIRKDNDS